MGRDSGAAPNAPHVRLSTAGHIQKQLSGYDRDNEIALIVSDSGRKEFATNTHAQMTLSTTAGTLASLNTQRVDVLASRGFMLRADPTNSTNIIIGGSSVSAINGMLLQPGDTIFIDITRLSSIWCIAASGTPKLYWLDM
jgi:hypothetical protein